MCVLLLPVHVLLELEDSRVDVVAGVREVVLRLFVAGALGGALEALNQPST